MISAVRTPHLKENKSQAEKMLNKDIIKSFFWLLTAGVGVTRGDLMFVIPYGAMCSGPNSRAGATCECAGAPYRPFRPSFGSHCYCCVDRERC